MSAAAEKWRDAIIVARDARGVTRQTELRRREQLEGDLAETRRNAAMAAELPDLIAKRERLAAELDRSSRQLDVRREAVAHLIDRLTRVVHQRCGTWLANYGGIAVDSDFSGVPQVFATELSAAGVVSGSAAQYEARLPNLVATAEGRRQDLAAFARRLSERLATIEALESEDSRRAAAAREAGQDNDSLDHRLSGHAVSGERSPAVAESLRTADIRLVSNVHKHVLTPMLNDLQYEKENAFYDVDPLESLTRQLTAFISC
jgi:hypothetical protein